MPSFKSDKVINHQIRLPKLLFNNSLTNQNMFTPKLSSNQQQMLTKINNSQSKGLCFLQMYTSPHRSEALHILSHLEYETVRKIKEELETKHKHLHQNSQCQDFCRNYYYAYRGYSIKSNKRNWALFGIVAFTLIDILCGWVLYKIGAYCFDDSAEKGEVVQSSLRSIMATAGKFIGLLVLGTYSGAGLWYGSVFLLWCLDRYVYRRSQSIQLKAEMDEQIRRHQN